jgi:cytochrome P450
VSLSIDEQLPAIIIISQWALIELSRHPEVQRKLQEELRALGSGDPTLEQLNHGFPYLDAFIHEVLRSNALVIENIRIVSLEFVYSTL